MDKRSGVCDDIDIKLLFLLRQDSSRPITHLAIDLGVTEGTIRNRINRLKRAGIIKKFTIVVEPKVMGKRIICLLLVNTAPGRVTEVARKLNQFDFIFEIYQIHTFADLLVKIVADDLVSMADFIANKVKTIGGIIGTQVITVLNIWKQSSNL